MVKWWVRVRVNENRIESTRAAFYDPYTKKMEKFDGKPKDFRFLSSRSHGSSVSVAVDIVGSSHLNQHVLLHLLRSSISFQFGCITRPRPKLISLVFSTPEIRLKMFRDKWTDVREQNSIVCSFVSSYLSLSLVILLRCNFEWLDDILFSFD